MLDLLWIPLLEVHQTGGLFSVTEQLMPKDSGAHTKHVHNVDEWFYVLDGTVDFELEGETSSGQDGDSLWIPRGTVHSFYVTSDVCHVLNGYTPGGFEQVIKGLARPAPKRELPPRTEEPAPEDIAGQHSSCSATTGPHEPTTPGEILRLLIRAPGVPNLYECVSNHGIATGAWRLPIAEQDPSCLAINLG